MLIHWRPQIRMQSLWSVCRVLQNGANDGDVSSTRSQATKFACVGGGLGLGDVEMLVGSLFFDWVVVWEFCCWSWCLLDVWGFGFE